MAASVDLKKCTGCGDCVECCPTESITIENEKAIVNDDCIDCGVCVDECSTGAISVPD